MIGGKEAFLEKGCSSPSPKPASVARAHPLISQGFSLVGEAARRSVSRTAVNNERSLSSSFVQSGACVHRNNRRHPVRGEPSGGFFPFSGEFIFL